MLCMPEEVVDVFEKPTFIRMAKELLDVFANVGAGSTGYRLDDMLFAVGV